MKTKNERTQKIVDAYQYGNITFLEAVQAVMNMHSVEEITSDEAALAIKQIGRIKLPF